MTLIDTEQTPTRPQRRRWPIIAAAAAVVGVGGLLFATRDDDEPQVPAGPATLAADPVAAEAQRVVIGFLDAYGAFDADQAMAYLTDEALAGMWGTPESLRLELGLLESQGYKETITGCEPPADSSSGTTVRCAYDFHGIRSDEMGLGPYSDNHWELTVRDGKIVSATNMIAFETNGFSEQVWEPFAEWLATRYPDDVVRMYESGSQTEFRLSEESIRLWEQRSREYVDSRVGFVGLPRSGATSSNPATPYEELMHAYWCEPAMQVADRCGNEFWLSSDGRLIWSFQGDLLEGANPLFTGLLEQRLTPQGVESFRTEFAELEDDGGSAANYDGLVERLRDPSDWASGTWVDPEIRAYVPSTYNVGFAREDEPPLGAEVLALLPAAAQDLLRDRTWGENHNGNTFYWGTGSIPTDDIRTLVDILEDAGVEQGSEAYDNPLRYRFDDPSSSATIHFVINPELP